MTAEPTGVAPGGPTGVLDPAGPPGDQAPGGVEPSWELFLAGAHGPARTVAYAQAAEAAGFAGVWLAEHHFISYGQTPSATVLAGHILGATTRITVGTAACVLSARHPVALGEEAALLDAVAPGRFRLGVARGGPWAELEVLGTGLDRYRHGFPEALDLLRRWLSGAGQVGAAGERFRFREVAVVPRPAHPVPVWVAATSPSTVELAAVRGLPLLLGVHEDEAGKAALLDQYARVAAGYGHDPSTVPHASVHLGFAGDPAALRPQLVRWLATTREYVRLDGAGPARDPAAYADHLLRIHPAGEVAASARRLGVHHVLLMVEGAGQDATLAQISALGRRLAAAPHVSAGD